MLISASGFSQFLHQSILPDLDDEMLMEAIVRDYKPNVVLSESNMKDTLMLRIYREDDGMVRGIYTLHAKPLSGNSSDPNQEVFDNGQPTGLNVEHIYPKDKGAKIGFGRSDMHHLAPAKVNVNGDRNNLPFAEIPDQQTSRWYWMNQEITSPPTSNIDDYSEWTNERFEPREDTKGNVARAMFYFYTMYRTNAMNLDPNYFDGQRATLCDWHFADPVDDAEWDRTFRIGSYQQGKPNPFVLDCSLARLYCPDLSASCAQTVSADEVDLTSLPAAYPNPAHSLLYLPTLDDLTLQATLYDLYGQAIAETQEDTLRIDHLPNGLYVLRIAYGAASHSQIIVKY